MERSKDVLAVMGLLCVNREFRDRFFADPRTTAESFVGELSASELQQVDDLAGRGELPPGLTREEFVPPAKDAFDGVYAFYLCPRRPCPGSGFAAPPAEA